LGLALDDPKGNHGTKLSWETILMSTVSYRLAGRITEASLAIKAYHQYERIFKTVLVVTLSVDHNARSTRIGRSGGRCGLLIINIRVYSDLVIHAQYHRESLGLTNFPR